MKPAHRSRPIALYIAWTVALIAAVAYQFRATEERFPRWFAPHAHAGWPFLAVPDNSAPQLRIAVLQPNAIAAGLKENEVLTQVNGRVPTGAGMYGDAVADARPGDTVQIQVRSNQGLRTVSIRLGPGWQSQIAAVEFIGGVLVPVFCILLGFWVTAIRPRDKLAWLLLAFLLGLPVSSIPFFNFGDWGGETSARSINMPWMVPGASGCYSSRFISRNRYPKEHAQGRSGAG